MSSSLKEKASQGCYHCSCCSHYHGIAKGCDLPECAFVPRKLLEDEQKEIAKLQTRLNALQMANDGLREQLEEQDWYHRIKALEDKNAELKQKLQQFENFLNEEIVWGQKSEQEHFLDKEEQRWSNGWHKAMRRALEKFEGLLKDFDQGK